MPPHWAAREGWLHLLHRCKTITHTDTRRHRRILKSPGSPAHMAPGSAPRLGWEPSPWAKPSPSRPPQAPTQAQWMRGPRASAKIDSLSPSFLEPSPGPWTYGRDAPPGSQDTADSSLHRPLLPKHKPHEESHRRRDAGRTVCVCVCGRGQLHSSRTFQGEEQIFRLSNKVSRLFPRQSFVSEQLLECTSRTGAGGSSG